ncbi:MAG: N-formylglutamate amidohydrolase [Rhizobiales bacterium]|nr:N-formylglutamate amidohydrolase [Hyphomicrobiales bacterium]
MDISTTPQTQLYENGDRDLSAGEHDLFARPFELALPDIQTHPLVFCSPHSGRTYPQKFVANSRLDALMLRRSEDSFVEEIFSGVVGLGAPLLHALFPRAYLDANREPYELDPTMFQDALPPHANTRSLRVAGGLGTIARIVSDTAEIYREPLLYAEAERRIRLLYMPFHAALRELLEQTRARFGKALLIDCHSMPSVGGPADDDTGADRPDIVLGDRYGTACARDLTDAAEASLKSLGYTVSRNNPYAGGFNTEHYGQPGLGFHALQIEINRALYMNEERLERRPALARITRDMTKFASDMAAFDWNELGT